MVTVQCTGDGQFVVVVSRTATTPPLRLDSLSLLSGPAAPCAAAGISDGFAVFRFPVQACGTQLEGEAGDLVYENLLSAAMDVNEGPNGSITRDSTFKLSFWCRYSGDELVSLDTVILTVAPPPSVVAPGPLSLELRIARGICAALMETSSCPEEQYSSYYGDGDYPVTKVLRDPVPVEVRILGRTDPNIVLMLDNCWATSVASPLGQPQWDLLVHGCPYSGDDYVTSVIPVSLSSGLPFPTHYKRFMIRMFTFVNPDTRDPLEESIFIHCSASVCFPSAADRCVASCKRRRK
ncbi:ZP4 protein, partial [Amia calva]|nr:ZP4 protein [Amia calva]